MIQDASDIISRIKRGELTEQEAIREIAALHIAVKKQGARIPRPSQSLAIPYETFFDAVQLLVATTLRVDAHIVVPDEPLSHYGFNSILLTEFSQKLLAQYPNIRLQPTTFMQHGSLGSLCRHLYTSYFDASAATATPPAQEHPQRVKPEPAPRPSAQIQAWEDHDIAIIGIGGKFPGALDINEFWSNLVDEKPVIKKIPKERWSWQDYFGDIKDSNKTDCCYGAFIDDVDQFDPLHFHIAPKEAELIDPQQRLLLQATWETLENAGYAKADWTDKNVGFFIGAERQDYLDLIKLHRYAVDPQFNVGNAHSMLANRVSHFFGWKGPVSTVNAACAGSFSAIYSAVQSLNNGDADMAIAGGINLLLAPDVMIYNRKLGLFTSEEQIRPFDKKASGHFFGDGLGLVCLRRMKDAVADNNHILGVIKGMSVRHGGGGASLFAPNPRSHSEIIEETLLKAGLRAKDIDYLEAQGTANPIADRVELQAYHSIFSRSAENGVLPDKLLFSSLKGHIGHLASASGVVSLIKCILSLNKNTLTRIGNFESLNWDEDDGVFGCQAVTRTMPWASKMESGVRVPRHIGIHNFGFGGVNGHLILEEYLGHNAAAPRASAQKPELIVLSARTLAQLKKFAQRLVDYVNKQEFSLFGIQELYLADIAYTLLNGRELLNERVFFVAHSLPDLLEKLGRFIHAADNETQKPVAAQDAYADLLKTIPLSQVESMVQHWVKNDELEKVGELWRSGCRLEWTAIHAPVGLRKRIPLPAYVFETKSYWITPALPVPQPFVPTSTSLDVSRQNIDLSSTVLAELESLLGVPVRELQGKTALSNFGLNSIQVLSLKSALENQLAHEFPLACFKLDRSAGDLVATLNNFISTSKPTEYASPRLIHEPDQRFSPFPMTDLQQSYWLGRRSAWGAKAGSLIYYELRLPEVGIEALNTAWNAVVANHEMLRCVISDGGEQSILEHVAPYRIEQCDYRALPMAEQNKMRRLLREQFTRKIYDTKLFPLFTLCISKTKNEAGEECLLHFAIDPIIADGASIKLLLRQLEALIRHPEQTLTAPTTSFRDYTLSVKNFQSSQRVQKDEEYWKLRLTDLPDGPQLLKAPESALSTHSTCTRLRRLLSAEVSKGLKRKAAELEVSVSTLILCLFTRTLHHYSLNPDFSLILTVFNRMRLNADIDKVVGPFTSTSLFAARHSQQVDFDSFVRESHAQISSDLDHRYVSGIRAIELARQENRHRRWPNLTIAFTSLVSDLHQEKSALEDAIGYSLVQTPHLSLEHQLSQTEDQLEISWYVAKQSYPDAYIERVFEHYVEVIEQSSSHQGRWPVAETVQHSSSLATRLTTTSAQAPLSYLQQAYLFGRSQFGGAKASYIYACFDIQEIDLHLLQKTWNNILSTHAALRTVFEKNGTQRLLEHVPEYRIQTTDLRTLPHAQAEAACDDIAKAICEASTDLGGWPYFDLHVTRRSDSTSRLHCKIDLLVADGACIEYLPELLFYHYEHPDLDVKAPACTYRDYAASLRSSDHAESEARCLSYWESKLGHIAAGPDFSFAKTAETKETKRFNRYLKNWGAIKNLAQQLDVPPTMVLLTAFMDVISHSVDQKEFSVAVPTWQRQPVHPDIYQVIGDFTSLAWISHQPSNNSFVERVLENAAVFKSDMQHSLVNGLRGFGKLKKANIDKRFPLVFSDLSPLKTPGHTEKFKRVGGLSYSSQVEWDHICFENGDELELCWDINAGLFSSEVIDRMFDRYQQFLASLPENREDFLDAQAASPHSQIAQWNATAVPYAKATCIHQLFEASALQYPDRIAVTDREQSYSYATLNRKSNQLAWTLQKSGVRPEVYVGICLPRTVDLIVGLLAILKAGGAYVPLESSDPSARLFRVIETAAIDHVLVNETTAAIFSESGLSLISISDPGVWLESESKPPDTAKSRQAAYAIFTSGSTGQPKGVAVEHRPVINLIEWAKRTFHFNEQDVALFITRLSFDLSVFDVFGMLAYGAKIIIVGDDQRENPQQISTLLCTRDVTFWNSAPGTLSIIAPFLRKERTNTASPSTMRLFFLSGDWIPLTLPDDIKTLFPKAEFISLGGATEATVWSNYFPVTEVDPLWRSIPYGRPIQNARYYILDQKLQHCPIGDEGDLYIGGECLSRGYLNAPAITANSFLPDPYSSEPNAVMYRTGDSARFYADGNIEFLGRKDHQVKVRGFRIELGEIEFHLLQHAHIAEAAVLVKETRPGDQKIVAYLAMKPALKPAGEIAIKELRAYLQALLPHYMVPNIFVAVASIPITANGKFDRAALPWPVVSPEDGWLKHQAKHSAGQQNEETRESGNMTTSSVMEAIEAIFLTALDCVTLKPDDDLFDRGATSFTLVQAVERIQDKYRIAIPFDVLLSTPTVRAIANYVAAEVALQHGSVDPRDENAEAPVNRTIELPVDDFHESHYQPASESAFANTTTLKNLGELLGLIKPIQVESKSKYLYSSAGGLTPLQVYVWVKENAVESLAQGVYYYHPDDGKLALIDGSAQIKTASFYYHDQALFDSSGFAIFMIAEMDAIAPLYGRASEQMVIVEAGYIGQLLISKQHQHHVSLLPVGGLDFDRMSCLFKLKPSQRFIHCILGGQTARMEQARQLSERKSEYHRKNAIASGKLHCIAAPGVSDIQLPKQDEAERIHRARAHLRVITDDQKIIPLHSAAHAPQLQKLYSAKRDFQPNAISLKTLGLVLSLFRAKSVQNESRYLHPSIDGEYGVDIHVLIQPSGVQGLAGGVYRYERASHQLVLISATLSVEFKSCFTPFNRAHAQASQFALFLSQKKQHAYFSLLESGYMGQLLLERQAELGIGVCPIGGMMFEKISGDFGFADDDMLMHSFLCGSHQMPIPDAYQALNSGMQHEQQSSFIAGQSDDIAIVGLSGRYPGARTPQEFARNLTRGEQSFSDIQFSNTTAYRSAKETAGAQPHEHSHHGGFLDHIDQFDSLLFKIAPSEARSLDPQVRLLLETVWECLESAGYTAQALNQLGKEVGVFVGAMWNDYQYYASSHWEDKAVDPVSHPSMANRISYFFDFHGPSISIDTSCCSAMTALHFACSSIKNGECAAAVVGGVNLMSHPYHQSHLVQLDLLSKDGHCYPFGKNAEGWVVGEGVGAVLLKPLKQAIQDRDFVLGVIKGSAISHGGKTSRFGAPNPDSQRRSIEQAIKNSSVKTDDISYVEAAAPGASLADASEVTALKRVFGDRAEPLYMGSVKANIGHLESASALSQLTKVLMQMQHAQLFPSLDCDPVNPMLQLGSNALAINSQLRPWTTRRKIALINAFGAAGSAGHVVIESHENQIRQAPDEPALVNLSAQSQTQLSSLVEKLHAYLTRPLPMQTRLRDVAFTLQVGRVEMPERLAIVANSIPDLCDKLEQVMRGTMGHTGLFRTGCPSAQTSEPLTRTASAWVNGNAVDWNALHSGDEMRIPLPTYSFAADVHWVSERSSRASTLPASGQQEPAAVSDSPANDLERIDTTRNDVERFLKAIFAQVSEIPAEKIAVSASFDNYGITSLMVTKLNAALEQHFTGLPKTLFFEYQTLAEVAAYLVTDHSSSVASVLGNPGGESAPAPVSKTEIDEMDKFENSPRQVGEIGDIAIIGLAGRYPGANTLDQFWRNLTEGKDSITEIPKERWNNDLYFQANTKPGEIGAGKYYNKWGGFIERVDCFDPLFFNISPKEAASLDPQERLFLEVAWECLEDAAYDRAALKHTFDKKVGVFVGVTYGDYQLFSTPFDDQGNGRAVRSCYGAIANRVSYLLDCQGPSMAVDTLCSSSLTALHLAIQSIRTGESKAALVGGINLSIHPNKYILQSQINMNSTDGRCRSFGDGGDGFVPGEGVAACMLRPLKDAIADGDNIYGVIKASVINNDGKTHGFTVPNPKAQGKLIAEALRIAQLSAREVSYVEAHGTGTSLGDPIEIAGLCDAFRQHTQDTGYCAIGSVKSNIGHLEAAAGLAGLTKILLQMKHAQLVPSLHSRQLNQNIHFDQTPFHVQQTLQPWSRHQQSPRIACLSSFGAGGSNAHVIVEEYRQSLPAISGGDEPEVYAILLSARTRPQLLECCQRLLSKLLQEPLALRDVAFTLQVGREAKEHRLAMMVTTLDGLKEQLQNIVDNRQFPEAASYSQVKLNQETAGDGDASEKQSAANLVARWLQGARVNWSALHEKSTTKRISLPSYPFAQESYWVGRDRHLIATAVTETSNKSDSPQWMIIHEKTVSAPFPEGTTWRDNFNAQAGKNIAIVHCPGEEERAIALSDLIRKIEQSVDAKESIPIQCLSCEQDVDLQFVSVPDVVFVLTGTTDKPPKDESALYPVFKTSHTLMKQAYDRRLSLYLIEESSSPRGGALSGFVGAAMMENPLHTWTIIENKEAPRLNSLQLAVREWLANPAHAVNQHPAKPRRQRGKIFQTANFSQVVYEQSERKIRQKVPVLFDGASKPADAEDHGFGPDTHFRNGGTYLIAGGFGLIGQDFCKKIAEQFKASIIVVSRRQNDDAIARFSEEIAQLGGHMSYYSVDIADLKALGQTYALIKSHHPRVNGILNLAGSSDTTLILRKTWEDSLAHMLAKVHGTENLDIVSADEDLDFFLLFSSVGAYGLAGSSMYAYACAFQNEFARYRDDLQTLKLRRGKTRALAWGPWISDPIHAGADTKRREKIHADGFSLIDIDTAFPVIAMSLKNANAMLGLAYVNHFDSVCSLLHLEMPEDAPLASKNTQVEGDDFSGQLKTWETQKEQGRTFSFDDLAGTLSVEGLRALDPTSIERIYQLLELEPAPVPVPTPVSMRPNTLPAETSLVDSIREVVTSVLELTELDNDEHFETYGLDSISGTQVSMRLEKRFNHEIKPEWLVQYPTVKSLSDYLKKHLLTIYES
jgi:amino acid adenylation domain-containing protein